MHAIDWCAHCGSKRFRPDGACISQGLNLVLGNFVLHRQVVPRLQLAFRAGFGLAVPHPEIRVFSDALEEYLRLSGH